MRVCQKSYKFGFYFFVVKNCTNIIFSNSSSRCFAIALFTLASVGFGTAPIALDDAVENVRFSLAWIHPNTRQ
jgi:hypothetical protein